MTELGSTRWRAAAVLLLVFLAGSGVGWAAGTGASLRADTGVGPATRRGGPGRGDPRPDMLLDAGPIARYNLSPVQRGRVDSILGARRAQIDAFWRGPGQEIRRVLDATAADVRTVLTPEQQVAFDAGRREHQRRVRARFGDRPGGSPGGPPPAER